MEKTPVTLLERVCDKNARKSDWEEFLALVAPFVVKAAGRFRLKECDADDLVQDVLLHLMRKLPRWRYDGARSFRGWLRTVTHHRFVSTLRRRQPEALPPDLDPIADGDAGAAAELFRRDLLEQALHLARTRFPQFWTGFHECLVKGRPVKEVAAEIGVKPGTLNVHNFRVRKYLNDMLAGLLD